MGPPIDRCPFQRPFPAGFRDCPAFQPIPFAPVDAHGDLLQESWTCRNLEPAPLDRSHFYARCRLGAEAERLEWAGRQGKRVERLRAIRTALVAATAAETRSFLRVQRELRTPGRAARLREAGDALIRALRATVESEAAALAELHFDPEVAMAILEAMVRHWEASREPVTSLEAPPELIKSFPGAADLLSPGPPDQ